MFNILWLLLGLLPSSRPFSFTTSTPSQCNPFTLSWTGGISPFTALLTLIDAAPYNFSIPPSAYNGQHGTFSFPLPLPLATPFIVTMSDANGFATGGSTSILTTGSGSSSCNVTNPGNAFYFDYNPNRPMQCSPFVFILYSVGSIPPVTIIGTVPGGTSFVLTPPANSTNYTWIADAAYNTVLIFSMFDSQGRTGGGSPLVTVGESANSTCLNTQSPSFTASPTSTGTTSSPYSGILLSGGAIAGIVVGFLVLLAIAIIIGFCLGRRKHASDHSVVLYKSSSTPFFDNHNHTNSNGNPVINSHYSTTTTIPGDPYHHSVSLADGAESHHQPVGYALLPPPLPGVPLHYQQTHTSAIPTSVRPDSTFNPYQTGQLEPLSPLRGPGVIHHSEDSRSMTSSQRKALQMYNAQSQVVVHTDAEDHPASNAVMIEEVPPQYRVPQRVGQYEGSVTLG